MRLLITGASGFIGSYLIKHLKNHYEVGCILLPQEKIEFSEDIKIFYGDITKPETLIVPAKWPDMVVHGAGIIKAFKTSDFYRINAEGTKNLIQALQRYKKNLRFFLFFSSCSVTGPVNDISKPPEEGSPAHPMGHYAISKYQAEQYVRNSTLPFTIFRICSVYGGGSKEYIDYFKLASKRIKPKVGSKIRYSDMIHAEDLSRCVKIALDHYKKLDILYNITDGQHYSWDEISDAISSTYDTKMVRVFFPVFLFYLVGLLTSIYSKIVRYPSLLTIEKVKFLNMKAWIANSSKFRNQFEIEDFTSLKEGFKQAKTWYIDHNWI